MINITLLGMSRRRYELTLLSRVLFNGDHREGFEFEKNTGPPLKARRAKEDPVWVSVNGYQKCLRKEEGRKQANKTRALGSESPSLMQ